jgi:UDP-N-acetylmuramate dehydrogenase
MTSLNLKSFNTLSVEAVADQVEIVASEDDIIKLAQDHGSTRLLVLGEGSNVLLAPAVHRVVCLMRSRGIAVDEIGSRIKVTVSAGENWHQLVMWTLERGYYGLENLALIPGSAGAAPVQNIGAYGVELADVLSHVDVVDLERGGCETFTNAQCGFGYRDSLFKRTPGRYAITQVTLDLSKEPGVVAAYPDLQEEFEREGVIAPTPEQVAAAVTRVRQTKLPDPTLTPNAGSFFKNPVVTAHQAARLQQSFAQLKVYPTEAGVKLSAAQLIDWAGWKERNSHGVRVWPRQPLVLVNELGSSGADILQFAAAIQSDIADRYGVRLEIEPDVIGFS